MYFSGILALMLWTRAQPWQGFQHKAASQENFSELASLQVNGWTRGGGRGGSGACDVLAKEHKLYIMPFCCRLRFPKLDELQPPLQEKEGLDDQQGLEDQESIGQRVGPQICSAIDCVPARLIHHDSCNAFIDQAEHMADR